MAEPSTQRVLVIRGGAIGDFILSLPVFAAIRRHYPDAETEVLGYARIADLAVQRRHAVAARRVDGAEWAPLFSPDAALADVEQAYLRSFNCVFCIWPDEDRIIRANLARAGANKIVYVNPIPPENSGVHVIEFMAAQCGRAGIHLDLLEPQLFPSQRDRWWAECYMRVTSAGEKPLLGMHPGSGSRAKNWPATGYAELARYWIRRRNGNVMVTAGPADEAALAEFLAAIAGEDVFVLCETSLARVAACLERCDVFVGNDSGIVHMAAAVSVPTLALFGPTDPRVWQPMSRKAEAIIPENGSDLKKLTSQQAIARMETLLQRV